MSLHEIAGKPGVLTIGAFDPVIALWRGDSAFAEFSDRRRPVLLGEKLQNLKLGAAVIESQMP